MTRHFVDAPTAERCTATITLKDNSTAQCGRHRKVGELCTQHAKIAAECSCGGEHTEGANYYVSMVDADNHKRVALLAGPFTNHADALGLVRRATDEAVRCNQWYHFNAFGTMAMAPTYTVPGKLNARLGL